MSAFPTGSRKPAAVTELHTGPVKSSRLSKRGGSIPRDRLLLAAVLLLLLVATRGYYLADTMKYVAQVIPYQGKLPAGPALWEFGHLLWRPLGWVLLEVLTPVLRPLAGWEPGPICAFGLMAVSAVCGFLTVLLWHSMGREIASSRGVAFLVAVAFACADAFLTYTHSGSSYVPGLFCVTLGVWVLWRYGARPAAAAAAAALAALGALLWFPYVLSAPGMLFVAQATCPCEAGFLPVWSSALKREHVRFALRFTVVFFLCLGLGFGLGAWAGHIGSPAAAKAWIADSSNGWAQTHRLIRLGTGLPRTFLFMGKDGILYRRFLHHDPYAPVTVTDLVKASLWKILLFDVFALALLYELWRSRPRRALALLIAGAVPVLLFAVLIFEPGSPERYLPAYPFVLLAVAWALRDFPRERRPSQMAIMAFLAAMVVTNIYHMNRASIGRQDEAAIRRIAGLKDRLPRHSLVAILSNQDALEYTCNRLPFAPINRPTAFRLYDVVEPATVRLPAWREDFTRRALAAWSRGGEVWVSKQFWRARPLPEWNWVEGDDPRISWKEIPAFFARFQSGGETGGPDGFVRLKQAYFSSW